MRILFCAPYGKGGNAVVGGIVIWARNLIEFSKNLKSDIDLDPVSFDRHTFSGGQTNFIQRILSGVSEIGKSLRISIQKINSEHYDVIHISTSASLSLVKDYILIKTARRKQIKTVVHFHFGRIPDLFKRKNWEYKFLKKILKLADIAITMDLTSYRTLVDNGYSNVKYCPNPITTDSLAQIKQYSSKIKQCDNKIIFVGHMISSKGVFELIEACRTIEKIQLHFIGKVNANMNDDLLKLIHDIGADEWIKIRGEMSHDDVIKEMLSARVFVLPSYTEGFPNVILEAMACGCPIVTTSVGAIPEMLDIYSQLPCGIVVPPRDTEALRSGIIAILNNKKETENYIQNARNRLMMNYTTDMIWNTLKSIWENLVCRPLLLS